MNLILGIFIFIVGFALGLKFFQIKKTKKLTSEKIPPMDEGQKTMDNSLETKDKKQMQLEPGILEKKMLYDEELTSLFKIGQELSGTVELQEVCKIIVENVKKVLNVERCVLLLLNSATDKLQIEYSFGLTEQEIRDTDIKKDESISGRVVANNEALFIKNIEDDYWIKTINKEKYYTKSLVSIPLSIKTRVFGVLNVNSKITGGQFTEDDLRLIKGIASQGAVAIQNAKLYDELKDGYLRTITALAAALDAKDHYTRRHSENVTRYATAIAEELKLTDLEIENIKRCGLLHDIGKIGIRDGILSNPRKLTEEEYRQIKEHSAKGQEIISSLPFLKEVALYVRHHHERFDGRGYPDGKKGYEIELPARILAVSDAFDAMVSYRPYRDALSVQEACEELKKCSSKQFDPEIVDVFLRILEKNPDIVKEKTK